MVLAVQIVQTLIGVTRYSFSKFVRERQHQTGLFSIRVSPRRKKSKRHGWQCEYDGIRTIRDRIAYVLGSAFVEIWVSEQSKSVRGNILRLIRSILTYTCERAIHCNCAGNMVAGSINSAKGVRFVQMMKECEGLL